MTYSVNWVNGSQTIDSFVGGQFGITEASLFNESNDINGRMLQSVQPFDIRDGTRPSPESAEPIGNRPFWERFIGYMATGNDINGIAGPAGSIESSISDTVNKTYQAAEMFWYNMFGSDDDYFTSMAEGREMVKEAAMKVADASGIGEAGFKIGVPVLLAAGLGLGVYMFLVRGK